MIDLASVLVELGVTVTEDQEYEVVGLCPGHEKRVGRQDRHPSWSMNRLTHVHSCFSCGYAGTLRSLVWEQLGLDPFHARIWLLERGVRRGQQAPAPEPEKAVPGPLAGFCDPPAAAMEKRHLEPFAVAHYGVRWDDRAWILPLFTPEGEYIGYQRKSKAGVKNEPPGMRKAKTVFGLDKLALGTPAILVESPLDAVRLYSLGIEGGVASLGAYVSRFQIRLLQEYTDELILALDNDAVGRAQTARLWQNWRRYFKLWLFNYGEARGKDPGELTEEEIRWGLENKLGVRARVSV